jgi:hypothetical protein
VRGGEEIAAGEVGFHIADLIILVGNLNRNL